MSHWKIWEYRIPLHNVLPASGESTPTRSGYLIQHTMQNRIRMTELAPLEDFHGISKSQCLQEFTAYMEAPTTEQERHSVTQLAIDVLEHSHTPPTSIACNALLDLRYLSPDTNFSAFKCVKLKLGRRPLDVELRELSVLLQTLPQNITLRIDANRNWNVDELSECARLIPRAQLDYFEEPLSNPEIYAELTDIPIALDESMQRDDHHALTALPNVVAAVLKPSVLGGLKKTAQLCSELEKFNTRAIISSTFESSLTLWAMAGIAHPQYTHGLGTLSWFKKMLFEDPVLFDAQHLYPQALAPKKPLVSFLRALDL